MHSFLSCPQCQARLRVPSEAAQGPFRCIACGCEFTPSSEEPGALDPILVEETRVQLAEPPAPVHPTTEQPAPPQRVGCFFYALALMPLGIAALGIPFCRFKLGWMAVLGWSALGVVLALACVLLVRRTRWPWLLRLLGTLGLAGGGYCVLLIALGISFWLWLHRIDPAAWRDFSPPGGRCHLALPGTPTFRPFRAPGLPPGYQVYELELPRQDIAFAIRYGDVPLDEWNQLPLQARFTNALTGIQSRLPGAQLVSQKRIALERSPGREYHLRIPGQGAIVTRIYFVRNRLYCLVIGGSRITPDAEETVKFFRSFRVDPLDEKQFPPLPFDQQPPDIEDEDIFPGRTILGRGDSEAMWFLRARDSGTMLVHYEKIATDVWDADEGRRLGNLPLIQWVGGNNLLWMAFALSPDGRMGAVGTPGGDLVLFDPRTQTEIAHLERRGDLFTPGVETLAFSSGGRYLASVHDPKDRGAWELKLWDAAAKKIVRSIRGKQVQSARLAFAPDGRFLVFGGAEGNLHWLDLASGTEEKRFKGPSAVTALVFQPDGKKLVASYADGSARLWDTAAGQHRVLPKPRGAVVLGISPNGRFLCANQTDGGLSVVETATGRARWSQSGKPGAAPQKQPACGLVFTTDGKYLIRGRQNRLERWQLDRAIAAAPEEMNATMDRPALAEPEPIADALPGRIAAHVKDKPHHGVTHMALTDEGRTLASCGEDCRVCFWDLASGKLQREWGAPPNLAGFAVSPDGKTAAVADAGTVNMEVFEAANGRRIEVLTPFVLPLRDLPQPPAQRDPLAGRLIAVGGVAFAPDGKLLALAVNRKEWGIIERWDPGVKKYDKRLQPIWGGVGCLAYSPDGRTLATGSDGGPMVRLHDPATGKVVRQLKGVPDGAHRVVFSADGRRIAAAGGPERSTVVLWDAKTGQELHRFHDQTRGITSLAVSPDGRLLASGGTEGQVHVYDTATGQRLSAFSSTVTCLLFSRDGRTLIAGGPDGMIDLWNVTRLPRPKAKQP